MRLAFVAVLLATSMAAQAQPAPDPAAPDSRFQLERQGDAFIRLDRRTGAVSTCTLENGTFDCRMSPDERAALQVEIDRLASENEQLKTAGGQPETGISKDGKELTLKLPTEEDLKQAMSYIEEMLRRLVAAVRSLGDA